jgi:hypothetical protein
VTFVLARIYVESNNHYHHQGLHRACPGDDYVQPSGKAVKLLLPKRTPMGLKFILSGDHSNLGFAPNRRFSEAIFAEDNQDKTV